jgi:hypothetical protein
MTRRMSIPASLLFVVLYAVPAFAGEIYLHDQSVAGYIDLGKYTTTGEVAFLKGVAKISDADKGPAPDPYPHVHMWESGYEMLGYAVPEVDGIWFINLGNHWVKNQKALVLWRIKVPDADARMSSEMAEDLTLSLWVDWDQNKMWEKDELVIRDHVNVGDHMPTTDEAMVFYYLNSFTVPDVRDIMSAEKVLRTKTREIMYFWVRGSIAYDDPDVSPDGEQLFGEVEDYRVAYLTITEKIKVNP